MRQVLLIDDEPDLVELIGQRLRQLGYEVTGKTSGADALDELDQHPYELVITDINMPGIGGKDIIVRLSNEHPDTVIVAMTGFSDDDQGLVQYGVRHFLRKPFPIDELTSILRQELDAPDA